MNWIRLKLATQPESEENNVEGRPQWDADFRLQAFPAMGMFEEYLEMGLSLCLYLITLTLHYLTVTQLQDKGLSH